MDNARPDLDALEALLAKATPGPWTISLAHPGDDYAPETWAIHGGDTSLEATIAEMWSGEHDNAACAALIVAAVNALPELIARVRELERERDQTILNRACADALVSAAQDMTQAAALAMRERCAQACEELSLHYDGQESEASSRVYADLCRGSRNGADACAAAIRALET